MNFRAFVRAVVFVVALGLALPAHAINLTLLDKPLSLDITESFEANDHLDPGDGTAADADYYELLSRLNIQASWNHFIAGIRLDSDAYFDTPKPGYVLVDSECPKDSTNSLCTVNASQLVNRYQTHLYDPVKGLERMYLGYSNSSISVTLGDSYVSLGRGLTLSLRKLNQLGVDTSLLGGKIVVNIGDFSTTLVAGVTNTQNLDETTGIYTPDPFDFIAGGRVDYRLFDKFSLGIEGAGGVQGADPTAPKKDEHLRTGVVLDAPRPLPWLSLYAEYVREADTSHLGVYTAGEAFYATATAIAGITSWTLEMKDYQNFQPWGASNDTTGTQVYMAPPTLERVQIQLVDNSNIAAGRFRGDIRIRPWMTLYFSPEYGTSRPGGGLQHDTLYDGYVGAEFRWNDGQSHLFPLIEYRHEASPQVGLVETLTAIETDFAQALPYPWSIEFQELVWLRDKPSEGGSWEEGDAYLAVKWAPAIEFIGGYEFTTQPAYQNEQHTFFNGSVQWNITPSDSINLFVGGQRPGLRCISGVCRDFPAFQGVRLSVTVRG